MIKKFADFDRKELDQKERESFERELSARKKQKQEGLFDEISFGEIESAIKDEVDNNEDYHISLGKTKLEDVGQFNQIQYDSNNIGRVFILEPEDNSNVGCFNYNGKQYLEDGDTIRNFYHYLKQLIKNDPIIKDEIKLEYDTHNESLKDKIVGKSEEEVIRKLGGKDKILSMDILDRIGKIREYGLSDEFLPSDEEIDELVKSMGGIGKYMEYRLDWMNHPTVEPIPDDSYEEYKDKIPNRDLSFEFWVMRGESLRSELKEYAEEIGEKIGFIKKINWGDDDQYIFTIKEK